MGLLLTISLFPSSFEPICFLKAHLLISLTCDPLFLPLGLNGFCSLSFANFFSVYVVGLGFLPFIWVSQKRPTTKLSTQEFKIRMNQVQVLQKCIINNRGVARIFYMGGRFSTTMIIIVLWIVYIFRLIWTFFEISLSDFILFIDRKFTYLFT